MANEQTLTGLELRKAVLKAAGWRVEKRLSGLIVIFDPQGKHITSADVNADFDTVEQAWEFAPAVESSVDAALMLIDDIPATFHLESPAPKFWRCWFHTVPMVIGDGDTPAEAICRAFLAWKAGA